MLRLRLRLSSAAEEGDAKVILSVCCFSVSFFCCSSFMLIICFLFHLSHPPVLQLVEDIAATLEASPESVNASLLAQCVASVLAHDYLTGVAIAVRFAEL